MKRILTQEQAAARDARKAKFKAIAKRVADMTPEQRAAFSAQVGCLPTCEGRALSPRNSMLVYLQLPGVAMVGGFRQWLKVGRAVRKGEHGASILIPLGSKSENAETGETSTNSDGRHFACGTVFDVAQTEEIQQEARTAA